MQYNLMEGEMFYEGKCKGDCLLKLNMGKMQFF